MKLKRYGCPAAAAAAVAASLIGVAACGSESEPEPATGTGGGAFSWDGLVIGGAEVSGASSVAELAHESDFVALGRFVGECDGSAVGSTSEGDAFTYECLLFEPSEVLEGQDPGLVSVPVEFLGEADGSSLPSEEVVAFLLDKGGDEAGTYRTVNSAGLITSTSRHEIDQPLRLDGPAISELALADHDPEAGWTGLVAAVKSELD